MSSPSGPPQVTPAQQVHTPPSGESRQQINPLTQQQLQSIAKSIVQQVLSWVVQSLTGMFNPGASSTSQLTAWADTIWTAANQLQTVINDVLGGSSHTAADFTAFLNTLLGPNSPLPAGNLFGTILPNLIPHIPAAHIGNSNPNLLTNPSFDNVSSLDGLGQWTYDAVTGHTAAGSATTTGAGVNRQLVANRIPVAQGDTMALSVWTMWSSLVATGTPIQLNLIQYLGNSQVAVQTIASVASPGASSAWRQLSGTFTIPSGVDSVALALVVGPTATAGNVWFDDGSVTKTGLVKLPLISGLTSGQTLAQDFQAAVDQLVNWTGGTSTGNPVSAIAGAFSHFFSGAGQFGTLLTNLFGSNAIGSTLQKPALPTLNKSDIPDLQSIVTNLFGTSSIGTVLQKPALPTLTKADIPDLQTMVDYAYQVVNGGSSTGNILSSFKASLNSILGTANTASSSVTTLQSNLSSAPATVIGSIGSVILDGSHTVQNLLDQFNQAVGGSGTGNGLVTVSGNVNSLANTANAAAAAAAAAQATLAAQAGTSNAGSSGALFSTNFGGANGSNLASADWNPYSTNLLIEGSNGYMGIKSGLADGTYSTVCQHVFATQNQSVQVVLGSYGGSATAPLYVVWHSTATLGAGGACAIITGNGVQIGFLSSGGAFTQFTGGSWVGSLAQGQRVEVHNVGTTYTLSVNGTVEMSCTDTSGLVTLANTSAQVYMVRHTTTGWFGQTTTYDCFQLASFVLSDYVQPTYPGSFARITKTTGSTTWASGILAANTFNVTDKATNDITVDRVNGKFTVTYAGAYSVKFRLDSGGAEISPTSSPPVDVVPVIYVNGTAKQWGRSIYLAYDTSLSTGSQHGCKSISGEFDIELAAGDYVQVGTILTNGGLSSWSITGDANGLGSWLSISLLNRSYA
ncbi:hypothetical protein [Mycolicibacterium brisbanense]|uniref:Bacteriophage membrane protein n=1 Tax=Mycolicibacterium brisbanense TaxID=146020 RepID=A0A100W6Q0_9MYCO|nr:hypothetical protein [Mycolicibacterium brisbanense]MCV7158046.1 hypothetical protein [Mycolicibacterium brisbanense]GAS92696.1 bacteriophage membrane protein [Mycolicibacterium brisbanense]